MTTAIASARRTRREVLKGGTLTIGFLFAAAPGNPLLKRAAAQTAANLARTLDPKEIDAFLAIKADGTVTIYCGKVDLGQGLRIAIRQIAAEELGIGVDKIELIEGDTALTPDQGRTSGSNRIQRGGMQIRQAAATARKALIELAARRLNTKSEDLLASDGSVRPTAGGDGISFAELIGTQRFHLKLDPKAPLKDPADYTLVGKSLPRPDVPAKFTGTHIYMHDFTVPGMLHARVIRPPAVGASLNSVDEGSIKDFTGARVIQTRSTMRPAAHRSLQVGTGENRIERAAKLAQAGYVRWQRRPWAAHELLPQRKTSRCQTPNRCQTRLGPKLPLHAIGIAGAGALPKTTKGTGGYGRCCRLHLTCNRRTGRGAGRALPAFTNLLRVPDGTALQVDRG